ncbi:MAG: hypothetical protein ABIJ30_01945 [bacterium]
MKHAAILCFLMMFAGINISYAEEQVCCFRRSHNFLQFKLAIWELVS